MDFAAGAMLGQVKWKQVALFWELTTNEVRKPTTEGYQWPPIVKGREINKWGKSRFPKPTTWGLLKSECHLKTLKNGLFQDLLDPISEGIILMSLTTLSFLKLRVPLRSTTQMWKKYKKKEGTGKGLSTDLEEFMNTRKRIFYTHNPIYYRITDILSLLYIHLMPEEM